jgi:hypothetical protein
LDFFDALDLLTPFSFALTILARQDLQREETG